ncbi:hypothetical protein TNCV_2791251 [Trichonephila clavipes]|nr:hypothetical protein TNCV_2791251 [Trichonephila clavipes]
MLNWFEDPFRNIGDGNKVTRAKQLLDLLPAKKVRDFTHKQRDETPSSLDTDDGSLWGSARSFRKKRSPISTLKGHTTIAYSDTEKSET